MDEFLAEAQARCDPRDHALLNELVLGTLRWKKRIDHVLASAANRPFSEIERPLHSPLRVAAYQLLFLDRVPDHAVVHEAVELAHHVTHRGGASFANAVLRRVARSRSLKAWPVDEADPVRRMAIEWSHPELLIARWLERFGPQRTRALVEANNSQKPVHLLAFGDRGGRERLAESMIDEGLELTASGLSRFGLVVRQGNPVATEAFARGDAYVQDEASQVAALLPPPRPGERIFDAAAAPGGKTFALIAAQPDVACTMADVSLARLQRIRENLQRLERRVPLLAADAARPPFGESFDRVLLDLPCSGTGTLRKHPELKWRVSEAEIERLARQGLGLLEGAANSVAPGGLLVAITCSLEEEENEGVAHRFLGRRSDFRRLSASELKSPRSDDVEVGEGFWRLFTAADHDGFTVQVLARGAE